MTGKPTVKENAVLTAEQADKITAYLATHHLPVGLGTKEEACSVAAINLALTGKLTDTIPECMSQVVGLWIIVTQDRLDDATRNSPAWKALLPLAAGTGRKKEKERKAVALDAMWEALAWVQPVADKRGFGEVWATMLRERTRASASASAAAASAAAYVAAYVASAYAASAYAASPYAASAAAASASAAAASAAAASAYAASAYAAYGPWALRTLERLVTA